MVRAEVPLAGLVCYGGASGNGRVGMMEGAGLVWAAVGLEQSGRYVRYVLGRRAGSHPSGLVV